MGFILKLKKLSHSQHFSLHDSKSPKINVYFNRVVKQRHHLLQVERRKFWRIKVKVEITAHSCYLCQWVSKLSWECLGLALIKLPIYLYLISLNIYPRQDYTQNSFFKKSI